MTKEDAIFKFGNKIWKTNTRQEAYDLIGRIYDAITNEDNCVKYPVCTCFADLKDKVITNIEGMAVNSDEIIFTLLDGSKYLMYHEQDCCENVSVCDVCGDVYDLIGEPIAYAYEASSDAGDAVSESGTWTFYNIATRKGFVTLRWLGESNGYYSERVDWKKIEE